MVYRCFGRSWCAAIVLLMLAGASGCQQQAANKLLGRWEGRPDTATARSEREAEKYGGEAVTANSPTGSMATDWESYDLGVRFEFVDREHLEMSLSDGSEPVSGTWRVLSTTPIGCTIEVKTKEAKTKEAKGEEAASTVLRQFQIDLDEREGECVGFTLIEVGADRQLGTLYFQRTVGM